MSDSASGAKRKAPETVDAVRDVAMAAAVATAEAKQVFLDACKRSYAAVEQAKADVEAAADKCLMARYRADVALQAAYTEHAAIVHDQEPLRDPIKLDDYRVTIDRSRSGDLLIRAYKKGCRYADEFTFTAKELTEAGACERFASEFYSKELHPIEGRLQDLKTGEAELIYFEDHLVLKIRGRGCGLALFKLCELEE